MSKSQQKRICVQKDCPYRDELEQRARDQEILITKLMDILDDTAIQLMGPGEHSFHDLAEKAQELRDALKPFVKTKKYVTNPLIPEGRAATWRSLNVRQEDIERAEKALGLHDE